MNVVVDRRLNNSYNRLTSLSESSYLRYKSRSINYGDNYSILIILFIIILLVIILFILSLESIYLAANVFKVIALRSSLMLLLSVNKIIIDLDRGDNS